MLSSCSMKSSQNPHFKTFRDFWCNIFLLHTKRLRIPIVVLVFHRMPRFSHIDPRLFISLLAIPVRRQMCSRQLYLDSIGLITDLPVLLDCVQEDAVLEGLPRGPWTSWRPRESECETHWTRRCSDTWGRQMSSSGRLSNEWNDDNEVLLKFWSGIK